jgi:hypothetical protein
MGILVWGMFHPSARACLQKQGMEKMAQKQPTHVGE